MSYSSIADQLRVLIASISISSYIFNCQPNWPRLCPSVFVQRKPNLPYHKPFCSEKSFLMKASVNKLRHNTRSAISQLRWYKILFKGWPAPSPCVREVSAPSILWASSTCSCSSGNCWCPSPPNIPCVGTVLSPHSNTALCHGWLWGYGAMLLSLACVSLSPPMPP